MSADKIKNAIAAVMALSVTCSANAATAKMANTGTEMMKADIPGMDRCYGVVKAGMNDCGNALHNCSGEAKKDGAKDEWVLMPTGLCKKIVGGSTTSG